MDTNIKAIEAILAQGKSLTANEKAVLETSKRVNAREQGKYLKPLVEEEPEEFTEEEVVETKRSFWQRSKA